MPPERYGSPDFIAHDRSVRAPQTAWLEANGATRFPFRSTSDLALQEAAERGLGLCLLAEAQARDVPGLVRVDVDLPIPSVPIFLAYHRELRSVPRHRIVARALEAALRHGLV